MFETLKFLPTLGKCSIILLRDIRHGIQKTPAKPEPFVTYVMSAWQALPGMARPHLP